MNLDPRSRRIAALLVSAAVVWHILAVLAPSGVQALRDPSGRDFASYYWAVRSALAGGDPYDTQALNAFVRESLPRAGVHPYFYPPPFLVVMAWVGAFPPKMAYWIWFLVDELALWASLGALWAWIRPLSPWTAVVAVVLAAVATAVPDNHLMGQFNFPVLACAIAGLWAAERPGGRFAALGGVLLGTACMMKMAPALLVAWWLLRGRYAAAGASGATALGWTLLSLPLVGPAVQIHFYTAVLPGFGSGDYNGLAVPVDMFGNHSWPNLVHEALGGGDDLGTAARRITTLSSLAVVGLLGALLWRAPADVFGQRAQAAAVMAAMLVVPVYTYEHHTVWLFPAFILAVLAVLDGRLGAVGAVTVGICAALWAVELTHLKAAWSFLGEHSAAGFVLREAKFGALIGILGTSLFLGRSPGPPDRDGAEDPR